MAQGCVLVVDDDSTVCDVVCGILENVGFQTVMEEDGERALHLAENNPIDVAILDLHLASLSGIDIGRRLRLIDPDIEIILLTGDLSLEPSLEAHHERFSDYLTKPIQAVELIQSVNRTLARRRLVLEKKNLISRLQNERDDLKRKLVETEATADANLLKTARFIGESKSLIPLRRIIVDVAPTDVTVLIRGESGTGKDIVAQLIHELSGKERKGNFIKINCPAIPETLLESEMFGHEAGSFTGADRQKPGRFELAAGGTVFLDEIGDLPLNSQAKLLQVIEHKQFTRVGGTKTIKVNARFVAATNAPLEELIGSGKFRADLFYRLNHFSVHIPPLRERREDIPLLAQHFLSEHSNHKPNLTLQPNTIEKLCEYDWPGNVRELKYIIDRFMVTGDEEQILVSLSHSSKSSPSSVQPNQIDQVEAKLIQSALIQERWNQRRAAMRLGVSYSALRRRIEKYGLKTKGSGAR